MKGGAIILYLLCEIICKDRSIENMKGRKKGEKKVRLEKREKEWKDLVIQKVYVVHVFLLYINFRPFINPRKSSI